MRDFKLILYLCLIIVIFLTGVSFPTFAQPETHFDLIDQRIRQEMKNFNIPGVALGIVKKDQVYYLKGYGVADSQGTPVSPQTPFILGSVSKSFTGLAIMQLVEQGKLNLDIPVQTYLPWFRLADPQVSKQITLRHLLSHTSGISTYAGRETLIGNEKQTLEQVIRNLKNLKLSAPLGGYFQYSNPNYLILGEVIETVSGIPYEKYIQQNIFTPLEMKHSYTSMTTALEDALATGYQPVFGWMTPTHPPFQQAALSAGYLISCAKDLTHYLIAQMGGGEYQGISVLSPEGIRQTHNPVSGTAPFYGMGWFISDTMIAHTGDNENFHTDMRILYDEDWGIVLLYNSNDNFAPAVLNKAAYEGIGNGVISILKGSNLPPENDLSGKLWTAYVIMNLLVLLIIALILWRIKRLYSWKRRFKPAFSYLVPRLIWLISFNFLLPYFIYTFIPRIFSAPWKVILLYTPGIGHVLLALPVILLGFGLAKIVLIADQLRVFQ